MQEIYQKIESLNFSDCHTKIRQVDALSTLSNGVVVQVTGELSNGGQPLRRFMQTFVLGPQVTCFCIVLPSLSLVFNSEYLKRFILDFRACVKVNADNPL